MAKKNPFASFKGPMMFAWCPVSKAWTPRNTMLGVNLRFFRQGGDTEVVRVRLDPEAFDGFLAQIKTIEFDGKLLSYEDIPGDDDVILPEGWEED